MGFNCRIAIRGENSLLLNPSCFEWANGNAGLWGDYCY